MAIGDFPGEGGHLEGFRSEIGRAATADDSFFTWFDTTDNKDAAFAKGVLDFGEAILEPAVPWLKKLGHERDMTALEIGCGGGRLLAAACARFSHVWGIDIHAHLDKVADELHTRGLGNFTLCQSDGASLPVPAASIDFIYSYIVFQHMERIEVMQRYVQEIARALRLGGVAIVYFGRYCPLSYGRRSRLLVRLDRLVERYALPNGYKELVAKVNCVNLLVSQAHARRMFQAHGLQACSELISMRPGAAPRKFGGQHGLVLVKMAS